MSDVEEDISIRGYRAFGVTMATQEIVLKMAEMIFENTFGEEDFKTQLPLNITDRGDRLFIEGSRNCHDYPGPRTHWRRGKRG